MNPKVVKRHHKESETINCRGNCTIVSGEACSGACSSDVRPIPSC